jgi:hypothetical protein
MHSPQQMDTFKSRIKRIQDPRYTHVVDPESGMKIPRRVTRDEIGKSTTSSGGALFMAALLGALCLMVARYLRIEVINVQPFFPDGLVVEVSMAFMAAVVIGGFVRMRSFRTAIAQFVGALVCAVTMHNAVWLAPDQFAFIFSQGYVDQILTLTDPMSIYVNGTSFTLNV